MKARTREVYEALFGAWEECGFLPTLRQLTERMGLDINSHLSSVYYAMVELRKLGLVMKQAPNSIGIYIPTTPPNEVDWKALLGGDGDGKEMEESREGDSDVLRDAPDSQEGG